MKRLLAAVTLAVLAQAASAELALPRDGWASWQVEASEGAQDWCCIQWKRKPASRVACDLDGTDNGYGTVGQEEPASTLRVYARFVDGKLDKIRALGPSCEVSTKTPIRDLGSVPARESARWLATQVPDRSARLLDDSLAALSQHRGSAPELIAIATGSNHRKAREQAWFWLSQARAAETEGAIAAALKKEPDRHVRHQAIFALSQLPPERAVKALGNVIADASLPREDRKQALFWMGQVDSPAATAYFDRVLGGK